MAGKELHPAVKATVRKERCNRFNFGSSEMNYNHYTLIFLLVILLVSRPWWAFISTVLYFVYTFSVPIPVVLMSLGAFLFFCTDHQGTRPSQFTSYAGSAGLGRRLNIGLY